MLMQAGALLSWLVLLVALPDDALIDAGSKKLQDGDAKGALEDFKKAAEKAPKDPRAHYLRGAALQKLGDGNGAEEAFHKALALDGKLAEVRNELATLLREKGKLADAERELRRAVADKPELAEAWFNLGSLLKGSKPCEAIDPLSKYTRLQSGDADGWIDLSIAARGCKKLPEAQAAASQAVKLAPRGKEARVNLAFTLEAAGKLDDAESAFKTAQSIDPSYRPAWSGLARLQMARGKLADAEATLKHAREIAPGDAAAVVQLAHVYALEGRCADMEKLMAQPTSAREHAAEQRQHTLDKLRETCKTAKH